MDYHEAIKKNRIALSNIPQPPKQIKRKSNHTVAFRAILEVLLMSNFSSLDFKIYSPNGTCSPTNETDPNKIIAIPFSDLQSDDTFSDAIKAG
ncbi:MAG: hypothetical protein ABIT08_17585, partial [Bacteroidia bacterium]